MHPTPRPADALDAAPAPPAGQHAPVRTLGWVLRRALVGLVLVGLISVSAALLMSAGIDPALEQASE